MHTWEGTCWVEAIDNCPSLLRTFVKTKEDLYAIFALVAKRLYFVFVLSVKNFVKTKETFYATNAVIAYSSYFILTQGVAGNNKVVSLNTGNRDIGSDDVNKSVDTREIIPRVKPDLLSRLKSVAAGEA